VTPQRGSPVEARMHRKWLPLNALRAFEAAGQYLSFTAAANSLTVAQSAVSRHVIVLEKFLGTSLFERRPQQLALTEAGRHLLPIVSKSFDRIDQAMSEIIQERGQPKNVLKVVLPPTFAHQLAIPLLKDFRAEHPDLALEIASKASPSAESDADIVIVYSEPRVTDTIHDLLWMVRLTILCSPAMLANAGTMDMRALIASKDLVHVRLDDKPRHYLWEMFTRAIGQPDISVDRGLVFDTAQLAIQYALLGEGLALVDPILFPEEIASGRLLRPFDIAIADGYGYYLTTHQEQLDNEAVSLFRSWLIHRFANLSAPPPTALPQ
jgi:DNA-binding transcriptional LysR family regulator